MSITTALKARREALTDREAGFTLIELLVVVIIIGILAAVAIPIYIGVQNNAKDSAVKSDLVNEKTAAVAYTTDTGKPVTSAVFNKAGLGSYGWSWAVDSSGKGLYTTAIPTIQVSTTAPNQGAFCISAISVTTKKFYVTSSGSVAEGTCPASSAW